MSREPLVWPSRQGKGSQTADHKLVTDSHVCISWRGTRARGSESTSLDAAAALGLAGLTVGVVRGGRLA